MLPDTDREVDIEEALLICRKTGAGIIELIGDAGKKNTFPIGTVINPSPEAEYHCVSRGYIYYGHNESIHRVYESGDIFLLTNLFNGGDNKFHTDFAAETISISESQLLEYQQSNTVFQKAWVTYEAQRTHLLQLFSQSLSAPQLRLSPDLQRFKAGSTIIYEGTNAECVYVLIEGKATVNLEEKPIGTINKNEIFGEMGLLTQSNRSASVHAETDCLVQILDNDSFGELISNNHNALLEIATQLSKRVVTLDKLLTKDTD